MIQTKLLNSNQLNIAAQILKNGGLVAVPTETVYGLAANAFDANAIKKIFCAKGRPMDNPLIVHIVSLDNINDITTDFCSKAQRLANAFWPGPLTIILPKTDKIPKEVSAGLSTVAIRYPSHPIVNKLIKKCSLPLAAPSANTSKSPSPTTASHVFNDLNGKIDAILDGGPCKIGLESTVIDLTQKIPVLLRPGAITIEQLKEVLGEVTIDNAVYSKIDPNKKVSSPGMKYKHYSPKANVIILKGNQSQYINYVNAHGGNSCAALCFDDDLKYLKVNAISFGNEKNLSEQAQKLFDALRNFDLDKNITTVYARCPNTHGIGLAVYNRLIRAAGFKVITLE